MDNLKGDPVANFYAMAKKRASTLEKGHPSILDETIQMTFEYLKATTILPPIQEQSPKSATKATELRSRGNLAFQGQRLDEALQLFAESIASAPVGSQELAFAYGDRSAVLIQYGVERNFIECLVDVNRALEGNYPEASKQKLIDRKNKCIAYLHEIVNSYKSNPGLFPSTLQKRDMDTLAEKCSPEMTDSPSQFPLPEVHFKNKLILNASDKIKIANTGDNKIGIFATTDIEPGEIIAIEKPVAWNLNVINPRIYCANCCNQTIASIPCPNCSVVMFCSTHCRDNAFRLFHRIECQILCKLPADEGTRLLDEYWTVFRILLVVTKQGEELDKIMNDPAYKLPFAKSFSHNVEKVFNAQDLSTVLGHLKAIDDQEGADFSSSLKWPLFKAVFSWLYLLKQTTYFGDQITRIQNFDDPLTKRELYVVTLLLKLSQATFHIFTEELIGLASKKGTKSQSYGQGLFPLLNMFRHSCESYVHFYSCENNMVCRSIRPIKAGEEIFISYHEAYFRCPRSIRREVLLEQYGFECTCKACEQDWPTEDLLPVGSSKIISNEISAEEFHKYRSRFQELQNLNPKELPSDENLEFLKKYSSILDRRYEKPCREIIECDRLFVLTSSLYGNTYSVGI